MSILKNLFGGKKEEELPKPNIDALLASPDSNGSIIELDNYICKLCAWGEHLERLSEPQRVFYFNQELEREINSGGFESFFYNSYGTYADETVSTLRKVGANQFAEILQQAINVFPNGQVPKDINERQDLMDSFEDDTWEQFDQKFYAYPENLNELNLEFVRKHKDSF
jgi:hypothetical protein